MKCIKRTASLVILFSLLISTSLFATNGITKKGYAYREGYLLVKRKKNVEARTFDRVHERVGAHVIERYTQPKGLQLVRLGHGINVKKAMELYQDDPSVSYAEPDYILHAAEIAEEDTEESTAEGSFTSQWFLHNTGQNNGTAGVDIHAPEMWEISKGNNDVAIAIIDTGIDYKHPDLVDNVWNNPSVDSDEYKNDLHGINAITGSGDPMDDNMHGTHVAGIIAAHASHDGGISGVMQKASLIGCKFLDANGSGSSSDAIKCINYVIKLKTREKNPVNIVATNNSWAGGPFQQSLYDAIENLRKAGILFVAAASNEGLDNDEVNTYPANYDIANIISVAASDNKDVLAGFSNYGRYTVHVTAPGVAIFSTLPNSKYGSLSGTSMATPVVAGLVGMVKAVHPDFTMAQIKNLVISSGQIVDGMKDKTLSGRRIRGADVNGVGALTCANQIVQTRILPKDKTILAKAGTAIPLSVMNINCSEGNGPTYVDVNNGESRIDLVDTGSVYKGELKPLAGGNYHLKFFDNDVVDVSVYDPSSWKPYEAATKEFNYVNIEGTSLHVGDDTVHQVTSPFPIKFGSDTGVLTSLYVGSNGTISLSDNKVMDWQNKPLPLASSDTIIAPLWMDLIGGGATKGDVYYAVVGEAPHRQLVVEWRNMQIYDLDKGVTFEVVFAEDNSDIVFNYKNVMVGKTSYDMGASATIGVQIRNDSAVLFSHKKASVKNETSLVFHVAAQSVVTPPALPPATDNTPVVMPSPTPALVGNMHMTLMSAENATVSASADAGTAMGCSSMGGHHNVRIEDMTIALLALFGFLWMRRPYGSR